VKWFAFAFCFLVVLLFVLAGIGWDDPHYGPLALMDGTAHRPFAYRVLTPAILRGLVALWMPARNAGALLSAAALGAFVLALRWLARGFGGTLGPGRLALALAGLLPFMLKLSHIYDLPTLALWAAGLGAMAGRRHALYFALFVAASLNRETSVLLAIIYAIQFGFTRWTFAQAAAYAAIRASLMVLLADRPGAVAEFHFAEHLQYMAADIERTVLYVIVFGIAAALVAYRFNRKPKLLRTAVLVTAPTLLLAYFVVGFPFEFRVFYEAYPAICLLILLPPQPSLPAPTQSIQASTPKRATCVLCSRPSVTTAAGAPVCQTHWDEYWHEARHWQSLHPFRDRLQHAQANRAEAV
jgi:hypothetical protein